MGSAGTIIGWIIQLFPMLQGLIQDIINAFKKTPTPAPVPGALDLAVSSGTILAFVMHIFPFLMPLVEDGLALAKADAGVALPAEVKAKVGEASKLFGDLAQALTGLDALVPAVKVIQELSDVLAALAA